jgi:SAM-dependent methyltransferase
MLREWITLLRLGRRRFRSDTDYRQCQAYQGTLILDYLAGQGIRVPNTRVLDLACGNGGYSYAMVSAGAHVVSIDLKRPGTIPPTFVVGDALRLPFALNSFPLVFCASLIEHVPDPAQLLAEIKRVLTSDGFVYLSFPPFYSPVGGHQFKPYHLLGERWALRLSKHKADSYATCFGDFGLYPLTIRRVRQLLAEAGFMIKHESTRFLPFGVSRIPILGEFLTWHVQFLLCR